MGPSTGVWVWVRADEAGFDWTWHARSLTRSLFRVKLPRKAVLVSDQKAVARFGRRRAVGMRRRCFRQQQGVTSPGAETDGTAKWKTKTRCEAARSSSSSMSRRVSIEQRAALLVWSRARELTGFLPQEDASTLGGDCGRVAPALETRLGWRARDVTRSALKGARQKVRRKKYEEDI